MSYGSVHFPIDLWTATHIDSSTLDGGQRVNVGYHLMDYLDYVYAPSSIIEVFRLVGTGMSRTGAIQEVYHISETELYKSFLKVL